MASSKKTIVSPRSFESKWDSFLKYSDNIILIIDEKGIITESNEVLLGNKKETIIGTSVYNFFSKDSEQKIKKAIEAVFKTCKPQ